MAQIKSEKEYEKLMERIKELFEIVDEDTPRDDKNLIELEALSELVEEYEDVHYPIETPSLVDVIRLRLYEMNITQAKLAELIGISQARVSEIMTGKNEPTLKIARLISKKLDISPSIVLGV
jgi:HTH-type transcriptional regulator/antitoxin HigA